MHMKKYILSTLLLLCAAAQGAWADIWDGSISQPAYDSSRGVYVIKKGAELAYIHQHWDDCYKNSYSLEEDLDLSRFIWIPLGQGGSQFEGTFYGNSHTIELVIENATANYQGLFADIDSKGRVLDLHVSGKIQCDDSRLVGGIAGQNDGDIINCWVSASVSSNFTTWKSTTAKVGGIVGENNGLVNLCCMTGDVQNHDADVGGLVGYNSGSGTVNHCTFYGIRYSSHKQDNVFVGDQSGNMWNTHGEDLLDNATLGNYLSNFRDAVGCDIYRFAILCPNPVNIYNEGYGAIESLLPGEREGKTVRLNKAYGSLKGLTITDAYGNKITPSGNETDGYTFTMPRFGVVVQANFDGTSWLSAYEGSQSNPYLIKNTEDWNAFAYYVSQGNDLYRKYVKLENDITITKTVGLGEEFPYGMRPFCGTFLGNGKTLTANLNSGTPGTGWNEEGVAPFHFIYGATIKDLTVAGTISSASYHTAGIVGFAYSTNLIENCTVTATLNISSNYAGGIIGHGENSNTTIKDCVFAGTINGIGSPRANIGGIWGWSNSGNPVFINCLEKGTYNNITSMHPIGLHGAAGNINDGFYMNPQIGTPDLVSTVAGASQVQTTIPEGKVYKQITAADGNAYYLSCEVSGIQQQYYLTSSAVAPECNVTFSGKPLFENIDYSVSYANNTKPGNATVTVTGKGSYKGQQTIPFTIANARIIDNGWVDWGPVNLELFDGTYIVTEYVDCDWQSFYIKGNAKLILAEGSTLICRYGIELEEGRTLTVEGPGKLIVTGGADEKPGIGAYKMGTLIINGGNIEVTGGKYAAAIGGSKHNSVGGRIVINGGVVKATGGKGAAAIGGGCNDWAGNYGVCGDIVINGGQITAISGGDGATAIGHGQGRGNETGSLTLGWTNPDDFLQATSIGIDNFTIPSGTSLVFEGTQTLVTFDAIRNGKELKQKIVPHFNLPTLSGEGTSDYPYNINSADDWKRFAENVSYGNSYSGKFVRLNADIIVSEKCGYVTGNNPSKAFSGTFLGQGHTITANIYDKHNQGAAVFSYIKDATIKNLNVAGIISSANNHSSGLVGFADGTNTIEGCIVTATLDIRSNYAGGIVGHGLTSATTIKDCAFAGTINGVGANRANIGGIWGWSDSGTPTLVNCLELGTYNNISSMHPMGLQNDKGTISLCYYKNPMIGTPANACTVSGASQLSDKALDGEISMQIELNGNMYYIPCVISSIEEFYELPQGGLTINPTVTFHGTNLSRGKDYTVTLDNQAMGSSPISVTSTGKHTLVVSGANGYLGSKTFNFEVFNPIEGEGTQEKPYVIRNANEWNLFATLVNRGTDFNGQYVKLGADMTVTTMAGVSADKAFKGTFLGDGKTLTVNVGTASAPFGEDYSAPFRYTNGATIQNLKVAGDIYTYKKFAAGLVANGSGTIANCQVSTVIHSSTEGDGTHGGLVALPSGQLTITDCIYSGRLLTTKGTQYCGGFIGWHHGQTIAVSSSLYAPNTAITAADGETDITGGATFVRGGSVGTDCFYTQALGDAQGTKIYDAPVAGELCMKAQAADGKSYYLPVTVSGIDAAYKMSGSSLSITPSITGYGTINPTLNDDYTATLNGNTTSFPLNITAKGNYTLVLTAKDASTDYSGSKTIQFVVSNALAGEGTAESPYLISSEDDWNLFATDVAKGQNFQEKIFKLNANISVSTMVGTSPVHSFQGTFLGTPDYTLTFTAGSPENPVAEDYCAPFRYVSSDTIQDLKVVGHIYTSKKFAAGLIGQSSGTSTITGCQVSTVIHSSTEGEGNHGGIVALPTSPLIITDCVYDGRLLTTNGTTHCGGFVGSANGQDIAISSSLYAPNTAIALSDGETDITDGATFVSGGSAGNYCYYTTPLGEAQGIQVSTKRPEGELCMQAQAADGNWYYLPCTVSGINAAYDQEADISITPVVTGLAGTALIFGTDFTVLLDGNAVTSLPISVTTKGDHTLTLTGQTENYSGSKNIPFVVAASFEGEGTEAKPYLISSTTDWAMLASKVSGGTNYSGKYVSLTDDIVISTPVGEREDKPFSGIFLGNGKTLTADLSNNNADAQGFAPFRYIKDATIQNVTLAGTIASNSRYTAGLAGFAEGTNLIEGCTVTATLNVSSDYAGGFVGHGMTSATTIRGCIFAGTINGVGGNRSNMAGFWGWSDSGTPVLENCLEKGTYTNISSVHPIGLQNAAGSITGCYYLTSTKGSPDHACTVSGAWQVSTTASADEIYKKVTAVDNATYYMLCTVSNDASKTYPVTGEVITIPAPVITAADNSALTLGTDFSYVTNPDIVKETGDYTLTITAMGNYSGIKSIPFSVSSNLAVTSSTTVMTSGLYTVYENVTINERINIIGDVVLNLSQGTKLVANHGIELSKGNKLTINGPGELAALLDGQNAGIGAVEVGTLVINGGDIFATGVKGAAIGGSMNNTSGGSITINGGNVFAMGSLAEAGGAAIGGGRADQPGNYGVCGDIVINGGQVTAFALSIGIGPGTQTDEPSRSNSGTLTLGWTKPDDIIGINKLENAKGGNHLESIRFAPGKRFIDANKKVIPQATIEDLKKTPTLRPLLAPADNGDNSELISASNGMKLPVMLDGRTLYKDGSWNTLCLPFDLPLSGSPLEGGIARPLESASISGSTLNLTFGNAVDTLVAGTPYIIKWASSDNIVNPVFMDMTIDATIHSYDNEASDDNRVRFLGTYKSTLFTAEDRSILLMGEKNTLYYPTTGAGIGAQRAYFKIGGDGAPAQANARRIKAYSINFGDEEVTGIISLTPDPSTMGERSDFWYTLDGRRLADKPAQSGVYINNGKKVIIK